MGVAAGVAGSGSVVCVYVSVVVHGMEEAHLPSCPPMASITLPRVSQAVPVERAVRMSGSSVQLRVSKSNTSALRSALCFSSRPPTTMTCGRAPAGRCALECDSTLRVGACLRGVPAVRRTTATPCRQRGVPIGGRSVHDPSLALYRPQPSIWPPMS